MSAHKQRYKNVGLDSSEMRRRREEEGIQLRKQKREQQLIKRRNVDNFQTMDNELENTITVLNNFFPPLHVFPTMTCAFHFDRCNMNFITHTYLCCFFLFL